MLSGDANAFMIVDPLATVLVVLVKGTLCGLIAGVAYKLLVKLNRVVAVVVSGILCPVVNTGIFLLGCQFFFLPTISEWAAMYGYTDAGTYMILGLAGINFLIELGTNIVLAPVITQLIKQGKK